MLFIVFVSICLAISMTCLLVSAINKGVGTAMVNTVIMLTLGVMLAAGVMLHNTHLNRI